MTIHSSLRGVNTLTGERSVLTRAERIQKLAKEGKFDPSKSVWGLPKVRTHFKVAGAKKVKKEAPAEGAPVEGEAAPAAPAAPAAAPAKGAAKERAPAKGKK
jgi:small basic protein (TIGR04137 family)